MGTRAVGYFREDAGGRNPSESLAEQNRRFLEFCRARGYDVAATFLDAPGEGPERSGYHQLLDYLRRRSNGVVVVVDSVDRLGKDMRQAARSYFQLSGLGVTVVCVSGEPEDPTTTLLQHWNAREESERIGERVRAAMRRKAVKGEVLGRPPYGYKVGARHRLEPVPDEAAIVRYMFRMYIQEGLGIRLIARRLNEEGYRTRKGGNWSMVTIRDILRNRVYLGTYARFGVRVPGSHQALIAPDDFRKAQDRMAARRTAGGPRTVSLFLLSGLAYCGACGNRMIGVSRRQSWTRRSDGGTSSAEYRYYQCGSRTNQSVCDYHTRRADQLDADVRDATITVLERALSGEEQDVSAGNELDTPAKLRARLRNLDRELDKVMDQAATGMLSRERLRAVSIEIAQRQLQLEEMLGDAERRTREREARSERQQSRDAALERLRSDWDALPFDERQALLREVLDRVHVYDDHVDPILKDR
jgi:site-specific DNA recombinase